MYKFSLFILLFSFSTAQAELAERLVAIVNTEAVLESDLIALQEKTKKPMLLIRYLLSDESASDLKKSRKERLNYLIGEKILESEIKRLNLTITSERVEQEIKDLAKRNGVGVEEIYQQLKSEGLSKSEYQDFMKGNIERDSLIQQEIVSKIRITDEDALAEYLRMNPNAAQSVDEMTLAHIFFSPNKSGGAEGALSRAEDVLKKLRAGEKFETLAQQKSEDPNFTSGGLLGTFKSGEFLKEIEQAVSKLSPGQTTDIVKSKSGFHIVKLLNKKLTNDPKFEKEKPMIRARLMDQAAQRQFKIWLQSKKDESFIRINN